MENEDYRIITLFNNSIKVFRDGRVQVLGRQSPNIGVYYDKVCILNHGYLRLQLSFEKKHKIYRVHRIVAMAFLGFDIDSKLLIDHINHNITDNNLINLRIATHSQNQMNTINKGYSWHKEKSKWISSIRLNGKKYFLGYFVEEEDARQAYLQGRIKYFGEWA
tara:strand:+ start:4806 stop:5294 length:489 start_codon:yes stop_codon:yes gene_type:complete